MKSLSQAVANKGWITRPLSILQAGQKLSLVLPISLTTLIAKCLEPVPEPVPQIRLSLQQTTGIPTATHVGGYSGSGKIKNIKNIERFSWWLSHKDSKSTPTFVDAKIESGEVKTNPWVGMFVSGEYRGYYTGPDPKPQTLKIEIEIEI